MAELEESIYSYSGLSNRKLFLDAQTFIILISLIHSSGMYTWSQCPSYSMRRAKQDAQEASGQHTAK